MLDPWVMVASGSGLQIDEEVIRRTLALLYPPEQGESFEIRAVPSGKSRHCKTTDMQGCINAIRHLDDIAIYYTINPIVPNLDRNSARNQDILRRSRILIDIDPVKPKGFTDHSSTEIEKRAARWVMASVQGYLESQGWPCPVQIDSGNGWHLLYQVDLPNDDLTRSWIVAILRGLSKKFSSSHGKVDAAVHNSSRIARLPGTWTRKGPNTEERPHRICKLIDVPPEWLPVPIDLLRNEAGLYSVGAKTVTQADPWVMTAVTGNDGKEAYVRRAVDVECGLVANSGEGERNTQLNTSSFSLGQLSGLGIVSANEIESSLFHAALRCGLSEIEARHTIRSGMTGGLAKPRDIPTVDDLNKPKKKGKATAAPHAAPAGNLIVRASEITPKKIEWLWPGRIPLGKLTTFAGVGGLGKTFVLLDIAARISTGNEWPCSGGQCSEPGQVLFISGEDDPEDTLVPRLIEMEADLSKIAFLKTEVQDYMTLADLDTLERALEQIGSDVRLVVIDPPAAFLGGIDDHKNSELRGLLSPLKSFASKHNVAIVFNTHVTKPQGAKVEAMMRVMGSVAWVNAVRAAHMFARDAEDPEKVLFVGMKMNIGKQAKGLAYKIVETNDLAKVEWLGEIESTADEAINSEKPKSRKMAATEWLIAIFRDRQEWPSDSFWASANELSITKYAINEARERLSIPKPKKTMNEAGDTTWIWHVAPDWPYLTQDFIA
jgi:putative DNA primase/helicase